MLAGGFAALMGASAQQDRDRIAAEREHARQALEAASTPREPASPPRDTRPLNGNTAITIPSYAFEGVEEPEKTPRRKLDKRHSSGKWSPTVGSPLRSEMKHEDYLGRTRHGSPEQIRSAAPQSRSIQDSGYYAPDDAPLKASTERDSDEFFSAGSEERERERDRTDKAREQLIDKYNAYQPGAGDAYTAYQPQPRPRSDYDETSTYVTALSRPDDEAERARGDLIEAYNAYDTRSQYDQDDASTFVSAFSRAEDDVSTVVAARGKASDGNARGKDVDDDPDREERRRLRREARDAQPGSREHSRDRGYALDDGDRKRRHRRREADESGYVSDTKSTVSEARSEGSRRKHKRRESERDGSTESKVRSRSSVASDPELNDGDRKASRRKSRREEDIDDNASMISTSSRRDEKSKRREEKEKEKEKEKDTSSKRPGLFSLFSSKSKENVSEPSKSKTKSRDDDDEDRKHRRRKHRSDRGSAYGSDDDDTKSTISTSSRSHREKRSSRSERDDREKRDRDNEKVRRTSLR
ncbi:hypothetical protein C7974DRAFT_381819 [Boeremia exigua]|uniref:uncharacterized protein n=1 Tax=Boeremia exigua TaxID=749465 RepID=UPI001E8D8D3D|nr:uncharacterized protein C7974DRAFT_381819 [Boeremia exigua]KAH6643587.1 hypothetical protein C7974DRAFT_381819 [Boeremia exigua]